MRKSIAAKLTVLIALSISTWYATSVFLVPLLRAQEPSPTRSGFVRNAKDQATIAARTAQVQISSKPPVAHYRISSYQASVSGNTISVAAATSITDQRQNSSCVWEIRTYDAATNDLVGQIVYDQQIFSPRTLRQSDLTFKESFNLAPGSYRVILNLYQIPSQGFDVTTLQNANVAKSRLVLSAPARVTVN